MGDQTATARPGSVDKSPAPKRWWLYLLSCADGRTYAGIAIDVAARYEAHLRGAGAKFTRSNRPTCILAAQSFPSKGEALRAEHALKRLTRTARLSWAQQWSWPVDATKHEQ